MQRASSWHLRSRTVMVLAATLLAGSSGRAGTAQATAGQADHSEAALQTPDYAFPSGAGMLFFHVKPDKVADFEAVIARLTAALDSAQDPVRKQQASSWRILKSMESTGDNAVYVFFVDPAVAGAGYDPVKILSEAAPGEMQMLYAKLKDSVIRVERMGLIKLR